MASVTVIGLPNVLAMFERAQVEAEVASRVGSLAAAQVLKAQMQAAAPKDTGRLAASIVVRETEGGAEVGATVPYARFVEFGTRYMAAQPFESQAADEARTPFVAAMAAVFKRLIR